MSDKAEYARLAQIFREAGQAVSPWGNQPMQAQTPQPSARGLVSGGAWGPACSSEEMAQYQAVSAVLYAIAGAYQRAADESAASQT